ncbi:hypothetical protein Q4603_02215 [Zobellia galactanivorans]|uniref:Tellurite resistance protein TerB n=1 Tax=Zobellia uliginosa TaxID=143224 RepID=A0ABY1KWG8_9FLAO|nr:MULTISPECIES: hypothetical protein [Zobellia]MBU3026125.1 hypothetical protein [Zobellia galactanivorans]MDO6517289.1 hypothetical protein [Zobellia uliginosa]MDO6807399.1 hypothetical protein [Zobellia galactanivorans]OWW27212.1 hypothetical protein B4Q04_05970 [Zobellia sp. OII3]SIS80058.1 hypothetical protein SAMN05421766_1045 [Zobellia uliginosa]
MDKLNVSTVLKSHFLRLYQMAFADDNFDIQELKMLYNFAEERGLSKDQLNEILLNPSQNSAIPESLEEKIEYLYDLALMIWADGIATEDETNTLKKYCLKFEFLEENIDDICEFLLENAKAKISKKELIAKMQD